MADDVFNQFALVGGTALKNVNFATFVFIKISFKNKIIV
jgi:hypothetical protein